MILVNFCEHILYNNIGATRCNAQIADFYSLCGFFIGERMEEVHRPKMVVMVVVVNFCGLMLYNCIGTTR